MKRMFRHITGLFVAAALVVLMSACSSTVGFSENERAAVTAFKDFNDEIRSCSRAAAGGAATCDKEKIWEALDTQSKTQYFEAYASLVVMDRIIEDYFDPIEHKYMRSKTGTNILKDVPVDSYKALFLYMFKPEGISFGENVDSGLEIAKSETINDNEVHFVTHANQGVTMLRANDGVWRNATLSGIIAQSLTPIFASESELKEYAKENLNAEMERRTKVRDYFKVQVAVRKRLGIQ